MPNIYLSKLQYTTCIIISCRLIFCYKLQISIILIYNGTHTYQLLAINTSHKTKQEKTNYYNLFAIQTLKSNLLYIITNDWIPNNI